jgi:hypothetical protein
VIYAPCIAIPFPLAGDLANILTMLRDHGLAYPEYRTQIIQYGADIQNFMAGQLPNAGGGSATS